MAIPRREENCGGAREPAPVPSMGLPPLVQVATLHGSAEARWRTYSADGTCGSRPSA